MSGSTPAENLAAATDAAVDAGLDRATINATLQPQTALDAQGVERIVSTPRAGGFTPAPVGPDPAAVRRAEAFAELQDAQRDARTASLTTPASEVEPDPVDEPDPVEEPAPAAPTPPATSSAPTPPSAPNVSNVSSASTTSGSGSSTGTV